MNHADAVFLGKKMETFVELVSNPQKYFERNQDSVLPESLDLKISAAALYLLVDCYLRGNGLKFHPSSKTKEEFQEALAEVWEAIRKEVESRPHMYPKLIGTVGRAQAAVDLDCLMDGFSRWEE